MKNVLSLSTPLPDKKSSVQKIFGSNLYLKNKKVSGMAQTQWAALCAARVHALEMPSCTVVVQLYNEARTFFQKSVLESGQ